MKKHIYLLFLLLSTKVFAQTSTIDLFLTKSFTFEPLKKYENIEVERISTKHGFELSLLRTQDNNKVEIIRILNFTGYAENVKNNCIYFSIDNYEHGIPDVLFCVNGSKGEIEKVLNAQAFSVSSDGRYICYAEPWQIEEEKEHDVTYWYIYDCESGKEVNIINTKQENNWDVGIPKYDAESNSFVFDLHCDADIMKQIEFFISDYF